MILIYFINIIFFLEVILLNLNQYPLWDSKKSDNINLLDINYENLNNKLNKIEILNKINESNNKNEINKLNKTNTIRDLRKQNLTVDNNGLICNDNKSNIKLIDGVPIPGEYKPFDEYETDWMPPHSDWQGPTGDTWIGKGDQV
jgi:hypothetical protein